MYIFFKGNYKTISEKKELLKNLSFGLVNTFSYSPEYDRISIHSYLHDNANIPIWMKDYIEILIISAIKYNLIRGKLYYLIYASLADSLIVRRELQLGEDKDLNEEFNKTGNGYMIDRLAIQYHNTMITHPNNINEDIIRKSNQELFNI